jgi:hypothetical protein
MIIASQSILDLIKEIILMLGNLGNIYLQIPAFLLDKVQLGQEKVAQTFMEIYLFDIILLDLLHLLSEDCFSLLPIATQGIDDLLYGFPQQKRKVISWNVGQNNFLFLGDWILEN